MIISDLSVKRPVLASVISCLLIAIGLVSLDRLSLREYPNIDPPVVSVEVEYPGAPANIVETRVTKLIEERISGIEGIEFIESESNDGEAEVTIQFSIDRNIDAAANDVRDRVSGISDNLPEGAELPEVQKVDSNDDVVIWRNLTSTHLTVPELTDYAKRYLVDQYSTLDGVARVRVGGGLEYALRIWLDHNEMAARDITVSDIERALLRENLELPAGVVESDQRLFRARVERSFKEPEDFAKLVITEGDGGYLVRLGDVARIEFGVVEARTFFRGNEVPMVGIGVIKQSTANTIDVANLVIKLTERINQNLPAGMKIEESYNEAVFIQASIREVLQTLLIAVGCVVLVIFLFLGNLRAMLIPAITVPISLMATFIAIYAFGFSINLLTLLALVLAIGLVVDDAIVMLENIVRRIQTYQEPPLLAAYRGARQVGFAIVATTLVLISVFVPITFLEGDLGQLFTEFAFTISAAICFSSLIALTLCPMLASKVLVVEAEGHSTRHSATKTVGKMVAFLGRAYTKLLERLLHRPIVVLLAFGAVISLLFWLYPKIPHEYTPKEDRGAFFIFVNGPEGATYAYMEPYMTEIEQRLMKYVEAGEIKRLLVRAPRGFGNFENFNNGIVISILHDWAKRRPAAEIMRDIRKDLSDLPGIRVAPVMRQGLGGGTGKPMQFVLGGATYEKLAEWRDMILERAKATNPNLLNLDSDYKETKPQIDIQVNYERAADLGVTVAEIGRSLEAILGGKRISTYLQNGEEYDVIVEGERNEFRNLTDIETIYVRSAQSDRLIPLANLIDIKEYGAATKLTRYNRVRAITLEANLEEGYRLGEALSFMNDLVKEILPAEVVVDYKGQSREYVETGASIAFVFVLGLVVVFLVLAAQFESYIHPLVIMLTVPLTLAGGLLGLYLTDNSINIYSQIGLIILVGLSAKNGILIVEFINQLRDEGTPFEEAILKASETRFRPIIMTGLTTFAGTLPLVLSSGAGAETRMVIGVVVLVGVIAATLFTLFLIPVAYRLLARGSGSPGRVAARLSGLDSIHTRRPE